MDRCDECGGSGICIHCDGDGLDDEESECWGCEGTGGCSECEGTGQVDGGGS